MRNPYVTTAAIILWLGSWAGPVLADDPPTGSHPAAETLLGPEGRRLLGRIVGDPQKGFAFQSQDGKESLPLQPGMIITIEGEGPPPTATIPPFRVDLGLGRRISGRLNVLDDRTITLSDTSAGPKLVIDRGGVRSVVQRVGEMQVFNDGFESLDSSRWGITGQPEVVDKPHISGDRSLKVPGGAASVTTRLPDPIAAGRLEVAFHDGGKIAAGNQAFVDLLFRGPTGSETIRSVLGWAEESLSVESPGGPALAVQRLVRSSGWHRLSIRFGPDQTEISVDGNDLAHGKGPGGPLQEIRLASFASGKGDDPGGIAIHFDDLRLVRFADEVTGLEVDPSQDEIRLGGDQVFGQILRASAERVAFRVDREELSLPWSTVSGLIFRRQAATSRWIDGLIVLADWRAAPGNDMRDLDQAEGALVSLTDAVATLETPYSTTPLTISRDRLRKIKVLSRGRRLVLDPTAHHLGNDIVLTPIPLDPPQPQGKSYDLTFELTDVPSQPAVLAVDVVQVVGEADGLPFSDKVRNGELRTTVQVNDKPIGSLNQYIATKNEVPERIRIPIPADLLKMGPNRIHIEQAGEAKDPESLDDLGVLEIGLETQAVDRATPLQKP